MDKRLQDKSWLEGELRTKSIRQLARELQIPHTTINGYVMRHGIDLAMLREGKTPGLSQPGHPSATKKVITREDILREYINTDASLDAAAAALGCSIRPLWLAMKAHGITAKPRGRSGSRHPRYPQLLDKAWLAQQLETKSMLQIAQELGTSSGNVSHHVKQHGLRKEHYDRMAAVREGIQKQFPNGRRGADAAHWQGGRRMTSAGHVYIYAPDHPAATKAGYVMEHRLVMEEHLGRPLDRKEHVHHINGDKLDNRVENLEVMTHQQHTRAHFDAVKHVAKLTAEVDRLTQRLAHYEVRYGPLPDAPAPPVGSPSTMSSAAVFPMAPVQPSYQ